MDPITDEQIDRILDLDITQWGPTPIQLAKEVRKLRKLVDLKQMAIKASLDSLRECQRLLHESRQQIENAQSWLWEIGENEEAVALNSLQTRIDFVLAGFEK